MLQTARVCPQAFLLVGRLAVDAAHLSTGVPDKFIKYADPRNAASSKTLGSGDDRGETLDTEAI
jgi:azurin